MSRNPHYIKMINSNKWKLLRAKKQSLCHSCHSDAHRRAFSHSKEAVQANNKRATERFVDKFLKLF